MHPVSRLAVLRPALLGMGLQVGAARVRRAIRGHPRHAGTAEQILRAGLEACWSGECLTASPGHYRQFWTRDTGFAAASLVRLGDPWPDRLRSSLAWALDAWHDRRTHVTTTIDPGRRRPADVFDYGVDSLPLLLHSLRVLGDAGEGLATQHASWIAAEVAYFVEVVVDPSTGLVRAGRHFSAHRDTFRNGSTAYANTMVALLARTVEETGWGPTTLSRQFAGDWGSLLRRHFWTGDRFRDRFDSDETSGEANVWPFFFGLVEDAGMRTAALETLRREGYATPYPLRFATTHSNEGLLPAYRLWSADYQTTATWTSLGSAYLAVLRDEDPAAAEVELDRMRRLVERDGTFWEVLDGAGRPWRSRTGLSVSDYSMLWGAILLELLSG